MPVTIKDIARLANVSPSTVSRVISKNPRISGDTCDRVLKIMKELDYHPNIMARSLAGKSTKIIGVILPETTEITFQHPFFPEILRGIGANASKRGYNMLLSSVTDRVGEKKVVREFVKSGITDGIILLTSRVNTHSMDVLTRNDFPFVLVGRPEKDTEMNWVDNNNVAAGYALTKYLIQKGHERIALLGISPHFTVTVDRHEGYKKALEDHKIKYDGSLVIEGKFIECHTSRDAFIKLFEGDKKPTGIIALDDNIAFEAIRYLDQMGLGVPKDVSIAGFNNVMMSNFSIPPLTSVDVNAFQLGLKAFDLLFGSMQNRDGSFSRAIVPTELIERQSVADIFF